MKKSIIALIGAVALISVLILGYIAYIKPDLGEKIQEPVVDNDVKDTPTVPLPVPDATASPIPKTDNITEVDASDWKTYRNEKFGYGIKYSQTINCEQELGISIDPADNYICRLKKQNNLLISIKPQIIEPSQDRISFYRSVNMGSRDTVDIQNKNILTTISSFMRSIGFVSLNNSNFIALSNIKNLIGFSKTEPYNSNTTTPSVWYDESWFFIHDNVLFSIYIRYDGTQKDGVLAFSQISELKNIITTLNFNKPSGIYVDMNPPKKTTNPQYNTNIAQWKNYTKSNYSFSIKYPAEWILKEDNNGLAGQLYRIFLYDNNNQYNWLNIDIFDNSTGISLDQYLKESIYTQNKTKQDVVVGGVTGERYTYLKDWDDFIESQDVTFLSRDKQIISISLSIDNGIKDQVKRNQIQEIFDKIISTFKFIN